MKLPAIANRIAVIPAHSASTVRAFGTIRLTENADSRRRGALRWRRIRPRRGRILGNWSLIAAILHVSQPPLTQRDVKARTDDDRGADPGRQIGEIAEDHIAEGRGADQLNIAERRQN